MGTRKTISWNAITIRGQTLRTLSRLFLMLLIFTHLITWYLMGIQIVGSIGIEALFSGLSRGVLNAGFFFWIFVFISALLFGRAFCGWFCWFGGYLELIEVGMEKTRKNKIPRRVLLYLGALAFVALAMKIYSSLLVIWLNNFPTMFTLQLADTEPWGGQQTVIFTINVPTTTTTTTVPTTTTTLVTTTTTTTTTTNGAYASFELLALALLLLGLVKRKRSR